MSKMEQFVNYAIAMSNIVEYAMTILGLEERPLLIFVERDHLTVPVLKRNLVRDDAFLSSLDLIGTFNRSGWLNSLYRWLGRLLGIGWLYDKGRFNFYSEPPMFDAVEVHLSEYEMPDGSVVAFGYNEEWNLLAVKKIERR